MTNDEMRFWSKVAIGDGCWIWMAGPKTGYGQFKTDGRMVRAHVVSWLLTNGPLPEGHDCVLHNCPDGDNPRCVRPTHLWTGTQLDNIADMVAKGRQSRGDERAARQPRGENHRHSKLSDVDVVNIRSAYRRGGVSQRVLAADFGVSQTMIGFVVRGENWTHLHDEAED